MTTARRGARRAHNKALTQSSAGAGREMGGLHWLEGRGMTGASKINPAELQKTGGGYVRTMRREFGQKGVFVASLRE